MQYYPTLFNGLPSHITGEIDSVLAFIADHFSEEISAYRTYRIIGGTEQYATPLTAFSYSLQDMVNRINLVCTEIQDLQVSAVNTQQHIDAHQYELGYALSRINEITQKTDLLSQQVQALSETLSEFIKTQNNNDK